jgi:hypothetical protein
MVGSGDNLGTAPTGRRLFFYSVLVCLALGPSATRAQEPKRFDLVLKAGALPKAQQTIKVKQGDAVELRWTSDQPVKLHLHGYDVMIEVKPGEPTVTALNARMAGRFSVEKLQEQKSGHQHGGKVLYLEVYP